jgi:hypothetical protein
MFKSELLGSKPKHYQQKSLRHTSDNKITKTKSKSKKRVMLSGWGAPLGKKSKSTDVQVKNFPITEDFHEKIMKISDKDLKPKKL